jgi:hypothetical protein
MEALRASRREPVDVGLDEMQGQRATDLVEGPEEDVERLAPRARVAPDQRLVELGVRGVLRRDGKPDRSAKGRSAVGRHRDVASFDGRRTRPEREEPP